MAETELVRVSSCVPCHATQALIADALAAAGLPQGDAARCAELMTEADLTGADGHGIFRLPQYVRRLAVSTRRRVSRCRVPRRRSRLSTATTAWAIWSCRAPRAKRLRSPAKPASPGSACGGPIMPGRP